ncbi:hypothetical protein DFR24_0366 [Panacagrimonas perspica]|uniref:Multidrug efflux pump subunit AcrA (Membrane-fusion protein) n=1 Tax=Panacagrimonas perspica TaxID=381431 RepID=A0A4R7PAP5_9GAMM|nr:hypothetical protein [Panacagrimonas perspica]TDU31008.1 hypothetical protein DFR24_0366 [Panacagrimonas perspica]THD01843.1 hypothetical protein B1810_17735 [Panacagrimonas perspica]
MRVASFLCASLLLLAGTVRAHDEGPAHHGAVPATVADRPHLGADGRLFVSKPLQHRLGIRTAAAADTGIQTQRLLGEVISHPDAPGVVTAPEPGRLEAVGAGWPVSGQRVKAGQELAVLRPLMSERDRAQRRAALAGIEQKRHLATVNLERMRLQSDARGQAPATDNVFLEQAEAERATQDRLYQLASEALQGRVVLRALASGVLTSPRVRPGDVVAAGAALFDISGASRVRIAADIWDARVAQDIRVARLDGAPAGAALSVRGVEPQASGTGWRLLLDAPPLADRPLLPGELVSVIIDVSRGACGGTAQAVWVHSEPEWFERRQGSGCDATAVAPGERVVVSGAALLDEYR